MKKKYLRQTLEYVMVCIEICEDKSYWLIITDKEHNIIHEELIIIGWGELKELILI